MVNAILIRNFDLPNVSITILPYRFDQTQYNQYRLSHSWTGATPLRVNYKQSPTQDHEVFINAHNDCINSDVEQFSSVFFFSVIFAQGHIDALYSLPLLGNPKYIRSHPYCTRNPFDNEDFTKLQLGYQDTGTGE